MLAIYIRGVVGALMLLGLMWAVETPDEETLKPMGVVLMALMWPIIALGLLAGLVSAAIDGVLEFLRRNR
jgi:DMSO reductase anchor subunit